MKTKTFKHYSDPGHGWIAVSTALILELGIGPKISLYSRIRGNTVYLEEDGDALAFVEAYTAKFGVAPTIASRPQAQSSSVIRRYPSFSNSYLRAVV